MHLLMAALLAATTYRFTSVTEGQYPSHASGKVTVAGKQWRIDFDKIADDVALMTAAIAAADDGPPIAINDENQTWYRLKPLPFAMSSGLFTFPSMHEQKFSNVKVARAAPDRITFSYRFEVREAGERLRGDVWGEMRVRVDAATTIPLPWDPTAVNSGVPSLDDALRNELSTFAGTPIECTIAVSRRLDGAATFSQKVTRRIDAIAPGTASPEMFRIPAGYREQEPVVGVPGR
jgi:hypothetical protein